MPGRRLNTEELRLKTYWQSPGASKGYVRLSEIQISGGTGIRGIKDLVVPFRYPVTAICGKNGVGKTTILALAALAHHPPSGWTARRNSVTAGTSTSGRKHHVLNDFFYQSSGDVPLKNVTIKWTYVIRGDLKELSYSKVGNKRIRYSKRPAREVDYLSVSRVVPAHEMRALRKAFATNVRLSAYVKLGADIIRPTAYILGKGYESASISTKRKHQLHKCKANAIYTSFNMGAGESCLFALVEATDRIPKGGLLIIEEPEMGLHPEAQIRLARHLIHVACEKRIQIICSTHSESFIDALPREARLLLRKDGPKHEVVPAPSTRFAMHELAGDLRPELRIYCEDKYARRLIEESVPSDIRSRIEVTPVGSSTALARQIVSHVRGRNRLSAIALFDGDVSQLEMERMLISESEGNNSIKDICRILPGNGINPESWTLSELSRGPYLKMLAETLRCTLAQARGHVDAIKINMDSHNIGHELHLRTGRDEDDCISCLARSVATRHPQFDSIRDFIRRLL